MAAVERIKEEAREIGLVSLYFLACFLLFLTLKKLLLEQYDIQISVFRTALIGALVVAKVVVLLDKTDFGGWFRSAPVIVHILWRSFCYTAAVFAVTLAERLYELYRETGGLSAAASQLWAGRDFQHFLAMNLSVALAFIVYNSFSELSRQFGGQTLRTFFFSPPK